MTEGRQGRGLLFSAAALLAMLIVGLIVGLVAGAPAAMAQQQDGRMTGLKLEGDKPIQIESDHLEVREKEGIAIFTGNVAVVQGPMLLRSGKMTVYYDNQGGSVSTGSADIDRLEVENKVYVKSDTQIATADSGTFDMKSEVLVLSGKEVVLSEGDNIIVGCKLTVQMASGLANLEGCGKGTAAGGTGGGRVKMLLKPASQGKR